MAYLSAGGHGYGDGGYIKMQRGLQHPYGLCCINCQPQYATAITGPPPTPAPPPPPPAPLCNATSKVPQRCFNVSGLNVSTQLLPNPGGRAAWADTTSWQVRYIHPCFVLQSMITRSCPAGIHGSNSHERNLNPCVCSTVCLSIARCRRVRQRVLGSSSSTAIGRYPLTTGLGLAGRRGARSSTSPASK